MVSSYGDVVPKQMAGYIVGSACVVCGVLAIAFAVPIVVANFGLFYNHAKARSVRPVESWRRRRRAADADASDALLAAGIVPPCPTCGARQNIQLMRDALGVRSADTICESERERPAEEDTNASTSTFSTEENVQAKLTKCATVSWADQYCYAEVHLL